MLDWLKKRPQAASQPFYADLRRKPTRGFPSALQGMERTPAFDKQSKALQQQLLEPSKRPADDRPLFVELAVPSAGSVMTILSPDFGGQCLPVFTSPFRAADYVRTQLDRGPAVQYLSSTPSELARMLGDVRRMGIGAFVIDRCPRCNIMAMIACESAATVDDVLTLWSIAKAAERTRADFCLDYAARAAAAGDLRSAGDVMLEAIGHVSPDDPRLHVMLGKIAVARRAGTLLREVSDHLRFLHCPSGQRRLDEAIASGQPDFDGFD